MVLIQQGIGVTHLLRFFRVVFKSFFASLLFELGRNKFRYALHYNAEFTKLSEHLVLILVGSSFDELTTNAIRINSDKHLFVVGEYGAGKSSCTSVNLERHIRMSRLPLIRRQILLFLFDCFLSSQTIINKVSAFF